MKSHDQNWWRKGASTARSVTSTKTTSINRDRCYLRRKKKKILTNHFVTFFWSNCRCKKARKDVRTYKLLGVQVKAKVLEWWSILKEENRFNIWNGRVCRCCRWFSSSERVLCGKRGAKPLCGPCTQLRDPAFTLITYFSIHWQVLHSVWLAPVQTLEHCSICIVQSHAYNQCHPLKAINTESCDSPLGYHPSPYSLVHR